MLTNDNPTHPELLAMLQCLEDRRAEKIRRSSLELQFKLSVLRHRAVAERAQIMSQFFQAVRESRDTTVTELGEEWYQIQQERRRAANTIPDYGIRFPATRAQAIKNAVSYNKEVSVLSGFAKHVGFPAAPPISGASEEQLEADFEAINVSSPGQDRFVSLRSLTNCGPRPSASQYPGRPRPNCPPSAQSTRPASLRSSRVSARPGSSLSNRPRGRTRTTRRITSSASNRTAKPARKQRLPARRPCLAGSPINRAAVSSPPAHLQSLTAIRRCRHRRHTPRWCRRRSRAPRWCLNRSGESPLSKLRELLLFTFHFLFFDWPSFLAFIPFTEDQQSLQPYFTGVQRRGIEDMHTGPGAAERSAFAMGGGEELFFFTF